MNMKEHIIGHTSIVDFFEQVLEKGTLSHAYCFSGRAELGKRTMARTIAARLLGSSVDKLDINPDFVTIAREKDEKTGKTKKDISIKQIRGVVSFLTQHALQKDGYKVVIIDNAEHMSVGASNALLKILEEPRSRTVLFLITRDSSELLATIQSRCQTISFSLVSTTELQNHKHTEQANQQMYTDAHGLPGRILHWIKDPEAYRAYKQEQDRFVGLFGKAFYEKLNAVDELFGDKTDYIGARERLSSTLRVWHTELHTAMQEKKMEASQMLAIDAALRRAEVLLKKNIHPRLLVEHILLQLP